MMTSAVLGSPSKSHPDSNCGCHTTTVHRERTGSNVSLFNRCPAHRYDKMSVFEANNFRDMKTLLAELGDDAVDEQNPTGELPLEVKRRTHHLCARFLGGAWKSVQVEDLALTRLKGGMSNMLFLCRLPEHHRPIRNEPDKVLMRIYFNPETESHLVAESVIFTLLSERHLGPKLYGIFNGGRLEEYIPSRPLSCSEIGLPNMMRKIAKRLARVHLLEVPIWKEPDYLCDALERWLTQLQQMPSSSEPFQFDQDRNWPAAVPKSVTCTDLKTELQTLRRCVNRSSSPVVFCHNDLQEGNILLPKASSNIRMPSLTEENYHDGKSLHLAAFNPASPRLVLIDFEYASYNFRGFDFANHFVEYCLDYDVRDPPYYKVIKSRFPSSEQQSEFFNAYLSEIDCLTSSGDAAGSNGGANISGTSEDDDPFGASDADSQHPDGLTAKIMAMRAETMAFVPVSHFLWGVWSLLQCEVSPVEFGFASYARDRLALYYEYKSELTALDPNNE